MSPQAQARWHRSHRDKVLACRRVTKVFNPNYGVGTIQREWGNFLCDGKMISGHGVFDIIFSRDGKMRSINADNLVCIL